MKYFTPELLYRYGSDDPAIYKEAETEWENNCEQYTNYLQSVKDEMPAGLCLIQDNYYLHDAVICGMGQREGSFVVMLQLDTPPHSLLIFTYDLLAKVIIEQKTDATRTSKTHVEWQYDELERVLGDSPSWVHSILLSNGWEVRLHFRAVEVRETQAVFPVPYKGSAQVSPNLMPRSA